MYFECVCVCIEHCVLCVHTAFANITDYDYMLWHSELI